MHFSSVYSTVPPNASCVNLDPLKLWPCTWRVGKGNWFFLTGQNFVFLAEKKFYCVGAQNPDPYTWCMGGQVCYVRRYGVLYCNEYVNFFNDLLFWACDDYEKKPCRKEHDDECKWSKEIKQCLPSKSIFNTNSNLLWFYYLKKMSFVSKICGPKRSPMFKHFMLWKFLKFQWILKQIPISFPFCDFE